MKGISKAKWLPAAALAAFACLALLPAFGRAAGLPGEPANPAKSLLEKASKALGENRPWTTRVEKGLHIEWDTEGWGTLRADYTRSIKKPDKLKIDQDNSAYDHPFFRSYYYNGGDAWYDREPQRRAAARRSTANLKTLLDRVDGIAFYLAACDTFFTAPAAPGDSLLSGDGAPARRLRAQGGYDALRRRREDAPSQAAHREQGTRAFTSSKTTGTYSGRMVPFHVTVYDAGKKTNEFLWKEITFDEKLDDAIFEENRPPKQ